MGNNADAMSAARRRAGRKSGDKRGPRRLTRDARREQLIDVAMPLIAEHGISAFSLDELARRADVTRNLLYHYFPRARADILVAVARRAGHELTDGWVTDESIPLEERMAINFRRFIEHSEEPSLAWRVHRLGRVSTEPELAVIIEQYEEAIVAGVSLNNFGTPNPPALARLAIKGFIGFAETVLDLARTSELPREQVLALVQQAFASTIESVKSTLG
jgi:AcrR family transcriptional regulator